MKINELMNGDILVSINGLSTLGCNCYCIGNNCCKHLNKFFSTFEYPKMCLFFRCYPKGPDQIRVDPVCSYIK